MKEKKPAKTSTVASSQVPTPEQQARLDKMSKLVAEGVKNLGKESLKGTR